MSRSILGIVVAVVVILLLLWAVSAYNNGIDEDVARDENGSLEENGDNSQSNGGENTLSSGDDVMFSGVVSQVFSVGDGDEASRGVTNGLSVETSDGEVVFVSAGGSTVITGDDESTVALNSLQTGAEVRVEGRITSLSSDASDTEESVSGEGDLGIDGFMSLNDATVLADTVRVMGDEMGTSTDTN